MSSMLDKNSLLHSQPQSPLRNCEVKNTLLGLPTKLKGIILKTSETHCKSMGNDTSPPNLESRTVAVKRLFIKIFNNTYSTVSKLPWKKSLIALGACLVPLTLGGHILLCLSFSAIILFLLAFSESICFICF